MWRNLLLSVDIDENSFFAFDSPSSPLVQMSFLVSCEANGGRGGDSKVQSPGCKSLVMERKVKVKAKRHMQLEWGRKGNKVAMSKEDSVRSPCVCGFLFPSLLLCSLPLVFWSFCACIFCLCSLLLFRQHSRQLAE